MSLAISANGLYNLSKSSTVDSTVAASASASTSASASALALAVATSRRLCLQNLSIIIGHNQARCALHRSALSHTQYHPSIIPFNMPY
jgi:hypothetical protein